MLIGLLSTAARTETTETAGLPAATSRHYSSIDNISNSRYTSNSRTVETAVTTKKAGTLTIAWTTATAGKPNKLDTPIARRDVNSIRGGSNSRDTNHGRTPGTSTTVRTAAAIGWTAAHA
jgi:hypothetical protein